VGGPTVLVELAGWRLLTDPTFDPPGGRYTFGWGSASRKTRGPALQPADLRPVDAVLLSHDQHGDNLDRAGRALLPSVPTVVTTPRAALRLGHSDARGLAPWSQTVLRTPGRPSLHVTATPCRHGAPGASVLAGPVTGFAVRVGDDPRTAVWVTGDTVLTRDVRAAARRLDVDVAVLHGGGVRFGVTGPLRYSMTGAEVVELAAVLRPRVAVVVHTEGWSHFRSSLSSVDRALDHADADLRRRFVRLLPGRATVV
jgi:L-ascorbate metabolism protein UlaG (beta-lactamase superfamily)